MHTNNIFKLIAAIVICELAGVIGSVFTASAISGWYAGLEKPAFNPPAWVFGPVWTLLYALMGISLYLVWKNDWKVENHILERKRKAWNYLSERFWTGTLQKVNVIAIFSIERYPFFKTLPLRSYSTFGNASRQRLPGAFLV